MDIQLILSFLGASVLLALMPGPDNIFVLTESITRGVRHGVAITTGLVSGVFVHTAAAATGLSLVLQNSAVAFQLVKYFGAAYLFYLAIQAWREQRMKVKIEASDDASFNFGKLYSTGFFMNVLNPKVSLFFIAFLPQFVSPQGFHPIVQMLILGLIFMVSAWLIFVSIALLAGRSTPYLDNDKFWNITRWLRTGVLVVLGVFLLL